MTDDAPLDRRSSSRWSGSANGDEQAGLEHRPLTGQQEAASA
jgi:hypothetical protein